MNLIPTEDHEAFRRSVRAFVEAKAPPTEVRRLIDDPTGYDDATWRQMSDQLALPGLAVTTELGGDGSGWTEVALVMEELGRALLPSPYLSTAVIATAVLLESSADAESAELLSLIASGKTTIAVAVGQPTADDSGVTLVAQHSPTGWTIDGDINFVIGGAQADVLLVPATSPDGPLFFRIEATADGVHRTPLTTLDLTRRQARIELRAAPAQPVGDSESASRALARGFDLTATAIAAEQLGGAAKCLEAAVAYAGMRQQFGRAIGSFQAVKHMCADMLIDVESVRSTVAYAAWVADNEPASLPVAASLAKACASDAFNRVSASNIQIHGGIGFTWEHDAHLYYRRARSTALLFGDSHWHRERLAHSLGMG